MVFGLFYKKQDFNQIETKGFCYFKEKEKEKIKVTKEIYLIGGIIVQMTEIIQLKLGFVNSFLIEENGEYILVDAGTPKSTKKLRKKIEKKGVPFEKIRYIVVTHGHYDHVGALKEIKELTKAKVIMHEKEAELLEKGETPEVVIHTKLIKKTSKRKSTVQPVKVEEKIKEELSLEDKGFNAKIILTPGHTEGSISLIVNKKHAFIGDIAMKFPILSGGKYFPIIANSEEKIYESWKRLMKEGVEWIYPAHGKVFATKKLKKEIEKK